VENGFSVSFIRLEEPLVQLRRDAELPPSRLRKYLSSDETNGPFADPARYRAVARSP